MLDNIKTSFSISDLQELSGISVHNIRMWERRYNLLDPSRTHSNIRRYTNEHLKKLLNISFLLKSGYKISELASFTDHQFNIEINSVLALDNDFQLAINDFKMAMLNFDSRLFEDTYHRLRDTMSFYDLFLKVMVPFLEHIGSLWQTNSITVAHEHYVSNILRQKIFYQIEHLPRSGPGQKERYILFLPLNELHELGLLFIHYTLLMMGKDSIYLGPNVDIESLEGLPQSEQHIYVSYMTMGAPDEDLSGYFREFRKSLMKSEDKFWVTGARVQKLPKAPGSKNISIFKSIYELLSYIRT
ncbi:MAG: MerR family transcriptional regulator [Saprospiraceae bacterium]